MIKAGGDIGGRKLMLLGLSTLNLQRLQEGKPIKFAGEPFGFAGEVVIVWGETEEAIALELKASGLSLPEALPEPPREGACPECHQFDEYHKMDCTRRRKAKP